MHFAKLGTNCRVLEFGTNCRLGRIVAWDELGPLPMDKFGGFLAGKIFFRTIVANEKLAFQNISFDECLFSFKSKNREFQEFWYDSQLVFSVLFFEG